MKWLRAIPFWGWLLIMMLICYGVWNPTPYSVYGLWMGAAGVAISVKVLVTLITAAAIYLFITETFRTLGHIGLIIYLAIVGVILWVLKDFGWLTTENISSAQWWIQIPVAVLLTLGSQGSKLYRAATGRVGVDDPDTHSDDH